MSGRLFICPFSLRLMQFFRNIIDLDRRCVISKFKQKKVGKYLIIGPISWYNILLTKFIDISCISGEGALVQWLKLPVCKDGDRSDIQVPKKQKSPPPLTLKY